MSSALVGTVSLLERVDRVAPRVTVGPGLPAQGVTAVLAARGVPEASAICRVSLAAQAVTAAKAARVETARRAYPATAVRAARVGTAASRAVLVAREAQAAPVATPRTACLTAETAGREATAARGGAATPLVRLPHLLHLLRLRILRLRRCRAAPGERAAPAGSPEVPPADLPHRKPAMGAAVPVAPAAREPRTRAADTRAESRATAARVVTPTLTLDRHLPPRATTCQAVRRAGPRTFRVEPAASEVRFRDPRLRRSTPDSAVCRRGRAPAGDPRGPPGSSAATGRRGRSPGGALTGEAPSSDRPRTASARSRPLHERGHPRSRYAEAAGWCSPAPRR